MSPLQSGLDNDQASFRRNGIIYDQHESARFPKGRPWFANIDKKSGFPVGQISPKGWSAPWLPDQGAFRFSEEDPTRFRIDYEYLLRERIEAHAEYQTQKEQSAVSRGWDPNSEEKQAVLESLIGKPPLPVEPVAAAMQGNSWILGLTDKVDPRVEKFIRKETRREKMLKGLPDFSDSVTAIETEAIEAEPEPTSFDDIDALLDLEEEADPEATGGKRVNPRSKKTTKAA